MNLTIEDYPLPTEVVAKIIELAVNAGALFIGEVHGTQEIPSVVASLLAMLYERGYRGLGVEVPRFEQENLRAWLADTIDPIPEFYANPWPDGRGNREMLALIRRAYQMGFQVFCFDPGPVRKNAVWSERDAEMVENTHDTWRKEFAKDKIVLICGNNHAFLKPPPQVSNDFWPSFAEQLRQRMPEKQYRAINLMPVSGEFYNMGIRQVQSFQFLTAFVKTLEVPRTVPSEFVSMQLDIPECNPATFLFPPKTPGSFQLLRVFLAHLGQKITSRWKRKAQNV